MSKNLKIGKKGEVFSVEYLIHNGYEILEKNWRHKHKEVDIIARKGDTLIIVEVKTRKQHSLSEPFEAVDNKKQNLLIEAASTYIETNDIDEEVRFDIISVIYAENEYKLEHIKNAFTPEF